MKGSGKHRGRARRPLLEREPTTIAAGEFKARCLKLMDEVAERHSELVITKYGKPVAKLVPFERDVPDSFGALSGSVVYHEDIIAPDHESWDEGV